MRGFELFDDGRLVPLPDESSDRGVTVFLPGGRRLVGVLTGDGARWTLDDGRGRRDVTWSEDGFVVTGVVGDLRVSATACRAMADALLIQYDPPGDHDLTVMTLEEICPDEEVFRRAVAAEPATLLPNLTSQNGTLQLYWGVRFALAARRSDTLERLRKWALLGRALLSGRIDARMALTASKEPPEALVAGRRMERRDDLANQDASKTPASELTLLVRYDALRPFGETPLSAWFVLSAELWARLRRSMGGNDAILCIWGALEAREAWEESRRYRPPIRRDVGDSSIARC